MTTYWASCVRFTVRVTVDADGTIVDTAPVVRKFIGQPWDRLRRWMQGLGGLIVERLAPVPTYHHCAPRGSRQP